MRKGSPRRLSLIQKLILEELENAKGKVERVEYLSRKVARRYEKLKNRKLFWRLKDIKEPFIRELARRLHRWDELLLNKWSASFSRSLKNLEEKGLVVLERGGTVYRHGELFHKVSNRVVRVYLPDSPILKKMQDEIEAVNRMIKAHR